MDLRNIKFTSKGANSSSSHFDSNGLPLDISSGFHHPKLPSTCCVFTVSKHVPVTPFPTLFHPPPSLKPHPSLQQQQLRSNRVNYPPNYSTNNNFTSPKNNHNVHLNSFGTGTGTHNRRKILHSTRKHDNRGPDPSQNPHPHRFNNVQTTTETSSSRRAPQFGVCGLPPELVATYKSNIYIKVSDTIIDSYSFFEGSGGGVSSEEVSGSHSSSTELPLSSSYSTPSTFSVLESTTWSSGDHSTTPTSSSSSSFSTTTYPTSGSSLPPPSLAQPYILVSMTLNSDQCGDKVLDWLDQSSDILFVVGFCIIVFVKGCFVAILRYEIKEMVQKIKLLNGEDDGRTAAMNELIGLTSMYEGGNEDEPGEREGLMASSGGSQHCATDSMANTNIDAIEADKRKDSVISARDHHNCHAGNHVGNHSRNKTPLGNHVSIEVGIPITPTTTTVVAGCSINSRGRQHDGDDEGDDGGRTLHTDLGRKFRNENGGRAFPRNGNNNTTGLGGVTGSASAPIPIDSMAKA
ncbi:hypothetical protein Fcan01_13103 [Folsomia candida]|uniref:Uncharacterized protein n=1 Tax=Folsomia candida TaxID=158441 RepID=A0A226E4J3_FOLCA|nr:hypothetical protein Fcan01_13103 [Folsomia candida]